MLSPAHYYITSHLLLHLNAFFGGQSSCEHTDTTPQQLFQGCGLAYMTNPFMPDCLMHLKFMQFCIYARMNAFISAHSLCVHTGTSLSPIPVHSSTQSYIYEHNYIYVHIYIYIYVHTSTRHVTSSFKHSDFRLHSLYWNCLERIFSVFRRIAYLDTKPKLLQRLLLRILKPKIFQIKYQWWVVFSTWINRNLVGDKKGSRSNWQHLQTVDLQHSEHWNETKVDLLCHRVQNNPVQKSLELGLSDSPLVWQPVWPYAAPYIWQRPIPALGHKPRSLVKSTWCRRACCRGGRSCSSRSGLSRRGSSWQPVFRCRLVAASASPAHCPHPPAATKATTRHWSHWPTSH